MNVSGINTADYNHQNLVNNPPYITNFPYLKYMQDNKMDFQHGRLPDVPSKSNNTHPIAKSVLYAAIAGAIVGTAIKIFKKR